MTPEEQETWKRALLRFRKEKDDWMRDDHDSPLPHADRAGFKGLNYFDPEPSLRLETKLLRHLNSDSVIMTTSKGTRQLFNRVGHFELAIEGQKVQLEAYQSAERDDPNLFIPFKDGTSGNETYGAARYLDLKVEHNDEYAVDFNYAYNPYCTYSEDYVCPLPPPENWLKVPIRAGEKKYH